MKWLQRFCQETDLDLIMRKKRKKTITRSLLVSHTEILPILLEEILKWVHLFFHEIIFVLFTFIAPVSITVWRHQKQNFHPSYP